MTLIDVARSVADAIARDEYDTEVDAFRVDGVEIDGDEAKINVTVRLALSPLTLVEIEVLPCR